MNENRPGFIRCVHPKREGADWFPEDMAKSKSWQRSTGWTPQPLPESPKAEKTKAAEAKHETAAPAKGAADKTETVKADSEKKSDDKTAKQDSKKKLITADSI